MRSTASCILAVARSTSSGSAAVVIDALNASRTGLMGVSGLLGNSRQVLAALGR